MAKNSICSVDDCGKAHYGRGLCNTHYQRFRKHGDPMGGGTPNGEPERFYREVVLQYDGDDCLIWPFAKITQGYGEIRVDGIPRHVHRLVCEDVNGPPPTPKHQAAHSCGKGHEGCVTKGHLSWKTRLQNKSDELIHGTRNRGERHGQAKLTEPEVLEILAIKCSEPIRSIAKRFGVTSGTISRIQTGKTWFYLQEHP